MPQVVYSQAPYDAGGTGAGEHRQAPKLPEHTATGFLQQSQQLGQGGGGGLAHSKRISNDQVLTRGERRLGCVLCVEWERACVVVTSRFQQR